MANQEPTAKDAHQLQSMLDCLHKLLFDMLMTTDGRTTDLLETLMDEKMEVQVLGQEQIDEAQAAALGDASGAPYYVRESVLIGERSRFLVSHNLVLVCARHVPRPMFDALASRQEGIGKAISGLGLATSRKVTDCGWLPAAEAVDLFGLPLTLRLPHVTEPVPFKKYTIYFGAAPGIHLIEYFHPEMVRYRLRQVADLPPEEDA